MEAPAGSKADIRDWARRRRAGIDWDTLSAAIVESLAEWLPTDVTVLVFLPLPDEVNLNPLLETAGRRFVATRTPATGGLTVHELGGPLEVHRLGFLQPHASARQIAVEGVDVFLLPGLAFDLCGVRLGRGAGYFDELLSGARPDAMKVGVVPAELVVDRLPSEPHDVKVDYLATEEGVVAVAR